MLSQNLAAMKGHHVGDTIELPTPGGPLRLPVAASSRTGPISRVRSSSTARSTGRWWNDDRVNIFRVYLAARRLAGRGRPQDDPRAAERQPPAVRPDERRRCAATSCGLTDQWLALTYSQIAVAVLVAVLGIMNTLTVSIMDRRRELGVLQAVGARRRQIRYTIWMEALSVGFVGLRHRPRARRDQPALRPRDGAPRHQRDAAAVPVPGRDRADAVPGHPGRRVRGRALAGGVGGARVAGAGAGV